MPRREAASSAGLTRGHRQLARLGACHVVWAVVAYDYGFEKKQSLAQPQEEQ